MLRMRLRRVGKMKQPSYRVVIADQHAKRDGDFVEVVGHYNPRNKPNVIDPHCWGKRSTSEHWGCSSSSRWSSVLMSDSGWTIRPKAIQSGGQRA